MATDRTGSPARLAAVLAVVVALVMSIALIAPSARAATEAPTTDVTGSGAEPAQDANAANSAATDALAEGSEDSGPSTDAPSEETQQPAPSSDTPASEGDESSEEPSTETATSPRAEAQTTEPTDGTEEPAEQASTSEVAPLAADEAEVLAASPEYEINGSWVNNPTTIARGNPVVAEWRVNVNDANMPPSNDPVDDVTATFSLEKAIFDGIPDICLTEGVTTPSSISADGMTLTCNFGTVNMGTALVVQTSVVATGVTGEEVAMVGTSPSGETRTLPRIPIQNSFDMDLQLGQNTRVYTWDVPDYTEVDADVQWSLRLGKGSDPGPNTAQYRLTVTEQYGSPVSVGTHAVTPEVGCTRFDYGSNDDHPWSRSDIAASNPRNTSFVGDCSLAPVPGEPGVFLLTLTDINYDLLNTPDSSSNGTALPTDWNYIASGSLWFHAQTNRSGSFTVDVDPVTYTSSGPIEQTSDDLVENNTTNKSFFVPGSGHAAWHRAYTGSGGNRNDNTYEVSAGTSVRQYVNNNGFNTDPPPTTQWGNCLALDTAYVTLADADPFGAVDVIGTVLGEGSQVIESLPDGMRLEYYVGNDASVTPGSGQYDPNAFVCDGATGWTATPASLADAKAVRIVYPHSAFDAADASLFQLRAHTDINENVDVGQDVWMFGSINRGGAWIGPDGGAAVSTPDSRYASTTNMRDVVRIISAQPYIEKAAAAATVTPGVPADFMLTYSANGSGIIPDAVDDYEIVDTLPLEMRYEPGSAMCGPEDAAVACDPAVTLDAQGRQVLTWTLDGVATNEPHELRYQAFAEADVEPGTQLTNTAVSSYGGESSGPARETVTTTNNGYTTILKTADVEFIPNQNGDGVGTGSWTVEIESNDPQSQSFTDTIDILPYVGDQRGTAFSGDYSLDDVVLNNGGTVYYTDADVADLSDDPADASNGAAGTIAGNTVGWSTTKPADPTAIRVIGGELVSGGSFSFQVVITTQDAQPQDVYVNSAQARAEHTELVMRTSAALVVTDYTVAKSANPESGSTVRPGETIEYTVAVTQEGPVPAGAWFTDDLTEDVLDDAVYN
ncbi:hypothetical protein, partial [Georgenia halophila]|uniref:DUF7927 domain-containing protein n=1 Tax=Georgenia halophila TaxID=620889 RepID=UPI0031E9FE05